MAVKLAAVSKQTSNSSTYNFIVKIAWSRDSAQTCGNKELYFEDKAEAWSFCLTKLAAAREAMFLCTTVIMDMDEAILFRMSNY